jgi:hypothetical protein
VIDEISGICGFHNPLDETEFSWTAQDGATEYEVARSTSPQFCAGCDCLILNPVPASETYILDSEVPSSGIVFHYLVRSLAPAPPGSWGQDSSGAERTDLCP